MIRRVICAAVVAGLTLTAATTTARATDVDELSELTAYLSASAPGLVIDANFPDVAMTTAMGLMSTGRTAEAQAVVDRYASFPRSTLEFNASRLAPGVSAVGRDIRDFGGANLFWQTIFLSPQDAGAQELFLRDSGALEEERVSALRAGMDRVSGSVPGATGTPHELQVTARAAARLAATGEVQDVRLALAARDFVLGHRRTDGGLPGPPGTTSYVAAYLGDLGVDPSASVSYLMQFRGDDGGLANPTSLPMKPGVLYPGDVRHTALTVMAMTGTSPLTVGPSMARVADLSGHPVAVRLHGSSRYDTAAAVAARFPVGSPVFISSGENFPDALSGAALAGARDGALLLAKRGGVPGATVAALQRLKPSSITVLGGSTSISEEVISSLRQYTTGSVSRLAGLDRYSTSATVAGQYQASATDTVYVATGQSFPDGLAGGAAAGAAGQPLLLTRQQGVPSAVLSEIRRLAPARIVVLGGTGAVGTEALAQLSKVAPVTVRSGIDRFTTAAAVARDLGSAPTAVVATGTDWPDALTASALAATLDAPLLLSRTTTLPAPTSSALRDLRTTMTFAAGGGSSLDPVVLDALRRAPAVAP